MDIKHQTFLQADNSPYWLRIYETKDDIFTEDIFSVNNRQAPKKHPNWESAIREAMKNLDRWKDKIDGFESCISINDEGWPDCSISFQQLCRGSSTEAEYLKGMLSDKRFFDTDWAVMCENGFSLRILCVCNRIQIQVSKEIENLTEFVKNSFSAEEAICLHCRSIENACMDLQHQPDFDLTASAEATISKESSYKDITDRIALLIMEVDGKLDDKRRLAKATVLDLDQGSPMQYAVIVDIPNISQRGYYISARSTKELLDRLLQQAEFGYSATISYSLILSDRDIMLE